MNSKTRAIMTVTAMLAGVGGFMPGFSERNPAQQRRNDPSRPKTAEDLDKLAKAEEKRRRKAARR